MTFPLVSITTVTYNGAGTLRQTIESVLNQTYKNIEYFIIDGKSTDDTVAIAESYREQFQEKGIPYYIFSEPDRGMYDAINKGISKAHGEIIGNINSDDWYELDAVEKVVRCYEETHFDFMYANLRMVQNDGNSFIKYGKIGKWVTSRNWNHPTQFAKKSLYDTENYKVESMYDDFDLYLRVLKKGYHIEVLNEVLANFRMEGMSHEKSISAAWSRFKSRYRIYCNNGYSRIYILECFFIELAKLIAG